MRTTIVTVAGLALLAASPAADAQSRWSVEATGGAAVATKKLAGAELSSGMGFEAVVGFRFMPRLAAYAGWDWHHFAADQPIAGADLDLKDTGYAFGLRYERPFLSWTSAWVRAGGLANHIELEDEDGEIVGDSEHGLGWELGAGLSLPLRDRFLVTPGLRYRRLSRDVDLSGTTVPMDLRYFSVGIGASLRF